MGAASEQPLNLLKTNVTKSGHSENNNSEADTIISAIINELGGEEIN
jgi:hypothetical protein